MNDRSEAVAVVLAAGKGTRMKSDLPKVLVSIHGRPMIDYVLDTLENCQLDRVVVVVGYRACDVRARLAGRQGVLFAEQAQQLGTGHAVMVCRDLLAEHRGAVLVVAGDCPMIQAGTVGALLEEYRRSKAACILGTAHKGDPHGLGRIVRDAKADFLGIVEEKDATADQRRITEVNMSYYVFDCLELLAALDHIRPNNSQKEYYITDVPGIMKAAGKDVRALCVLRPCETLGINTVEELAVVEAAMTQAM